MIESRVADRVAGGVHDPWASWQVEGITVYECDDGLDAGCTNYADLEEPGEELPGAELPKRQLSDLQLVAYLVAGSNRALDLADPDFGAGGVGRGGKANVVGVGVGQDDRLDIADGHPDRSETSFELGEFLGASRIDDRGFATFSPALTRAPPCFDSWAVAVAACNPSATELGLADLLRDDRIGYVAIGRYSVDTRATLATRPRTNGSRCPYKRRRERPT